MNEPPPPDRQPEFFSPDVSQARRFYLDLAPPADRPIAVVCGGCEICTADYEIHRTTFPYLSIEFVAKGKGSLTLGDQEVDLLPGSVFSYGPGIGQHITTHPGNPLVKYFVDFTGRRASDLLRRHALAPGAVSRVTALSDVEAVFDALTLDGSKGTGLATDLCAALLEYLILKIAESVAPGLAGQTPAHGTYQRCRQYIVEHCRTLMSLGQIARACHVDRAYLCRLFRRYDRQTPHQFLMRRKMNLAAEQLSDPHQLVKQVAAELGFQDPFHFSRAFKRVFGLSPDAFRKQQR